MICEYCGKEIKPIIMKAGERELSVFVCSCKGKEEAVKRANEEKERFLQEMKANERELEQIDAGLSQRGRLQTFDTFNPRGLEEAFRKCKEFDPKEDTGLLILGNTGVGKTHLATAILNRFILNGGTGKFLNFPDYLAGGYKNSPSDYIKAPLLVIDEIGLADSDHARTRLYELINGRYESMKPTIYTSNVRHQKLLEVIGERNYDRLKGTCEIVLISGDSRRGK